MPIAPRSIADAFGPQDHKPLPTDTLHRALDKLRAGRWADHRSKDVLYSQGTRAIDTLRRTGCVACLVEGVKPEHVATCIREWQGERVAPDTIRKRLNVLRAMGVDLGKAEDRPKLSKKGPLKWWLSPSDEARLCGWLERSHTTGGELMGQWTRGDRLMMAQYIRFVTRSGLRVEEALALTWVKVSYDLADITHPPRTRASVTVEGTKTAGSHATLPLMPEAHDALQNASLIEGHPEQHLPIFHFGRTPEESYRRAAFIWEKCRAFLGQKDNPTATLKALRRSAARYLHISKGMPLDMVREYLRHDDIETTQGYLKLTGGYGEAEMRKWLTKDS